MPEKLLKPDAKPEWDGVIVSESRKKHILGNVMVCIICVWVLVALFIAMATYKYPADPYSYNARVGGVLVSVGVPADEIEVCQRWAFGDDVATLQVNELDDRWRVRHSDLFIVAGHDDLWESTRKIGRAYLER